MEEKMNKQAKFEWANFPMVVVYSIIVVVVIAFIAGKTGLPTFQAGYAILILIIGVILALIASGVRDFKVDRSEIIYFILVIGTLIGLFFLLKNYVPEIFKIIPQSTKEVFSFIK